MNIFRKMFRVERKENYKVFHILGFKIKHKSKYKKMVSRLEHTINQLQQKVDAQERIISLIDEKKLKILMQSKVDISAKYARALSMPHINRDQVESWVENIYQSGVSGRKGNPELIVSLTSYPARMYDLHLYLYSLLMQDHKPDKLILWLGEEQFPNRELDVPEKVKRLQKWGLEIKWCPDYKSFKKCIPAFKEYPDAYIVTADDDTYYPSDWLGKLWETHKSTGAPIVAHRCHRVGMKDGQILPYEMWDQHIRTQSISFENFFTGAGGVLYAPGSLHKDVLNVEKAQELCPHGDDIWLWGMAVLNHSKIAMPQESMRRLLYINVERAANLNDDGTLYSSNRDGGNDRQLSQLLAAYPAILDIIA